MIIHHLAIRVGDVQRSRDFYVDVLGAKEIPRPSPPASAPGDAPRPSAVWLRCDAIVLMLETTLRGAGPEQGSGHVLALSAATAGETLDACQSRLHRFGVSIDDRTDNTIYFRDPDGHRLALSDYSFPDS